MNLNEFLFNLHFDVEQVRHTDVPVNWEEAPLPYKLYTNVSAVKLASLSRTEAASNDAMDVATKMGSLLQYTYGLTQICHTLAPWEADAETPSFIRMLRRMVPSGGGLYPTEVYLYVRATNATQAMTDRRVGESEESVIRGGIYHYDVAHHGLRLLRQGNFDTYLATALGSHSDVANSLSVVFLSTVFWKNFFKYREFGYRLQAIDAGAVLGQLQEAGTHLGFDSKLLFQFEDEALNHLLGLDSEVETIYAAVPLFEHPHPSPQSHEQDCSQECRRGSVPAASVQNGVEPLPPVFDSKWLDVFHAGSYPLLVQMNRAAMEPMVSPAATVGAPKLSNTVLRSETTIQLPDLEPRSLDFDQVSHRRYSPGLDFTMQSVRIETLSSLLRTATHIERASDVAAHAVASVSLAVCLHGVEGLADGAYLYDASSHSLERLRAGDYRVTLQTGMSMMNVNLAQVPLCFHLVGQRDYDKTSFGYRGYRIQQMYVGMVLQRLLLCAAAFNLGGHPLLDYDAKLADGIYGFSETNLTCLIQVPVGPYQSRYRFESSLQNE